MIVFLFSHCCTNMTNFLYSLLIKCNAQFQNFPKQAICEMRILLLLCLNWYVTTDVWSDRFLFNPCLKISTDSLRLITRKLMKIILAEQRDLNLEPASPILLDFAVYRWTSDFVSKSFTIKSSYIYLSYTKKAVLYCKQLKTTFP